MLSVAVAVLSRRINAPIESASAMGFVHNAPLVVRISKAIS
jgi:hypothetical protein